MERRTGESEDEILSDPMGELPVQNRKYVRACTEMYLAGRNITNIDNFSTFVNLEVLWLQNNRIRRIENLEENIRIKKLYLHNNRIESIEDSSLRYFTFLTDLTLNNNRLKNLDLCLEELSKLRFIRNIDLSGNPVSQEDDYRSKIIQALPSLEVLDCLKITEEERKKAACLAARKARSVDSTRLQRGGDHSPSMTKKSSRDRRFPFTLSRCTKLLLSDLKQSEKNRVDEEERPEYNTSSETKENSSAMSSSRNGSASIESDTTTADLGLWEMSDLKLAFDARDKGKSGRLTREALRFVLEDMMDLGRAIEIPASSTFTETVDAFLREVSSDKDDCISWDNFSDAVSNGVRVTRNADDGDVDSSEAQNDDTTQQKKKTQLRLRWRYLTIPEAERRIKDLLHTASASTEKLLGLNMSNEADARIAETLKRESAVAMQRVSRLRRVATEMDSNFRIGRSTTPDKKSTVGRCTDFYVRYEGRTPIRTEIFQAE